MKKIMSLFFVLTPFFSFTTLSCSTNEEINKTQINKNASQLSIDIKNIDQLGKENKIVKEKIISNLEFKNLNSKYEITIDEFLNLFEGVNQIVKINYFLTDKVSKIKSNLYQKTFKIGEKRKMLGLINDDLNNSNTNNLEEEKNQNNNPLTIRIGNWNVLNFSLSEKNENLVKNTKIFALSHLINHLKIDVQGIIELDNEEAIIALVNSLNNLDPNAKWTYTISDNSENGNGKNKKIPSNSKQHELAAILYKSSILKAKEFTNNKISESYDNSTFSPYYEKSNVLGYVRPPYALFLETLGNIKNDFTLVIDHFDSPGAKKNGESKINPDSENNLKAALGAQEADEAYNLVNVMNYFDKLDGKNDDLIFMGDTNIARGNLNTFKPLLTEGYKNLINENINTSLGLKIDRYSNPYDKIFYKGTLETNNAKTYDLYNIINDKVLPNVNSLEEWKKLVDSYKSTSFSNDYAYIRSVISDHNPIYFDLILNTNDVN
ncbi:endonuclease/exonuclease/phosphatase family protein [Mycoplasmopsis meleagridis]|uniref:endonuclease/exonuclease/phosphatase family protein n=1 Tax=Mycoplasmopsis meleagridis TaxID=29561 RepID=UPI00073D57AA|nr:endonuclease/exonuclease/phosphatase family protein [Mycoplasmopsis meleagridis]KUH47292.1 hypothetical protein ASB56_02120 [Mycoplasmopsis meleagridis]